MTKYRKFDNKSASKSTTKTKTSASEQEKTQKTGSDYNPETWTQQYFREKREAEERIRKVEFSEGENFKKGIPVEKGIPVHDESEVE